MSQKSNKTLPIILIICLFIPLIVAIISAIRVNPYDISVSSLEKILLTTPDGVTTSYTDKETLSLYSKITQNSTDVDSAILATYNYEENDAFAITFVEKSEENSVYKLFLSEDTAKCVYVSPDKKYHKINPEIASKLIQRSEFSSINVSANMPVASAKGLEDAKVISPSTVNWNYINTAGTPANYTSQNTVQNPVIKFDKTPENSLELLFDTEPDKVELEITKQDGTVLYADDLSKLHSANRIDFSHDEKLSVTATVEWLKTDESTHWGELTYHFPLLYDIAPTYKVEDANKNLPTGEFTVLSMTDFNDGEKLYIENDIGMPTEVNVYDAVDKRGNNVKITFIPYGATAEGGDHELVLSTEAGQKETVKIKINKRVPDPQPNIFLDILHYPQLETAISKEATDEFDTLVKQLTSSSVNQKLYEGEKGSFVYPTGSSDTVRGGGEFGMRREFTNEYSYVCAGNDLQAAAGQEIKAANSGKVVFAGETKFLGNTVVVDHGYGILSYYGYLDSISVSVGNSVVRGETVVGKAGSTGFACVREGTARNANGVNQVMCYYAVSMNSVFVSPKSVRSGIIF